MMRTARSRVPSTRALNESPRPVLVDFSGRRQRRLLRAAGLLMILAGGYVALLISTVLVGPGLSSPFVPPPGSSSRTKPYVSAPGASPSLMEGGGGCGAR